MASLSRSFGRLFVWRRRDAVWRDMNDEMRHHVELEAAELERHGVAPAEARRRALVAFGPVERFKEEGWAARLPRWLEDLARDLRVSARALWRSPGFTVMALVCIALGVGVTAAVFALVDGLLLRPLPYPHADRLVAIYAGDPHRDIHGSNISRPDFLSWREQSRSFSGIGMWTWNALTLSGDTEAERVDGADVTPGLFGILGVRPALGRDFLAAEETPGRDHELLLSDAIWQRRFAADPRVLGRTVQVDGVPYTVVGVMPPGFAFPQTGEVWRPLSGDPRDGRANRFYAGAIARLRAGVTFDSMRAEMARISRDLQRAFPEDNKGWEAEVMPLRDDLVGNLKRPVLVFAAAVLCVLLIACANVANLLLARGAARQRELAVRTAIGAGRGRVVRQLLAESLVLAVCGALLGCTLTVAGVRLAMRAFPNGVPYYFHLGIDARVIAFVAVLAALTAIVFGTLPALRASAIDLAGTLKEGSTGSGESAQRARARGVLVIAEVALSLVLLLTAGLLMRSYRALAGARLGFDPRGVLSFQVAMNEAAYPEPAQRAALLQRLFDRLRAIPGVQLVGSARGIPMTGWDVQAGVTLVGRPQVPDNEEISSHYQWVTPDYFRTIGVPLVRGRAFRPQDRAGTSPAVIVNQRFVRTYLPDGDPIGRQVQIGGYPEPYATIVGVVGDFQQYRLPQPMPSAMFFDFFQDPGTVQAIVLRTSLAEPTRLMPTVRAVLREVAPDLPAYEVRSFDEVIARALWRQRLQEQMLGSFATLALLLALVGLYGVVAYSVGQRRRELGLRVALGASRRELVRLVVGEGVRLAAAGILIGLLVALVVTRALAELLYQVRPFDPLTFVGVPLLLALVALLASSVPAWSAARIDPQRALRAD